MNVFIEPITDTNINKWYIKIYNNNKKIIEKECHNLEKFILKKGIYKINIIVQSNTFLYKRNMTIVVKENMFIPVIFKRQTKLITFILTDQNYNGLKIKKGEVKLWQKNIT